MAKVTCSRCGGRGTYQLASGALGDCFRCGGDGVTGDRAERRAEREALEVQYANMRVVGEFMAKWALPLPTFRARNALMDLLKTKAPAEKVTSDEVAAALGCTKREALGYLCSYRHGLNMAINESGNPAHFFIRGNEALGAPFKK